MSDNGERGTVRVMFEKIRLESHEIEGVVVEGLAAAGYDVEIEPDVKPGKMIRAGQSEGGVTIKVFRRLDHV